MFGGGDIFIALNSYDIRESFSNFGTSYPDCVVTTENAFSVLAGSHHFQTTEIEVFTEIDQTLLNKSKTILTFSFYILIKYKILKTK